MVSRADDGVVVPDVPASYEPMLATTAEAPFDDDGWQFEIKWDGIRAIATTTRPGLGRQEGTALRSRRGNDLAAAYPELAPLWERVLAWQAVLDGEIVALTGDGRPSFERLQRRMNVHDERAARRMARQTPVTFVVFDVLVVDAEDLTSRPLDERRARLDDLVVPGGPLRRSDALGSSGSAVFAAAEQAGLEGVIGKRRMSPYRPGRRSADWVKIKVRRRIDVVIGGWLPKADTPGGSEPYSLLVGLYDGDALRMVARVGSGLTADERHALRTRFGDLSMSDPPFALDDDLPRGARWVRPLTVCTVEYSEVTESLRLRAPTYQGRRADADADADPRQCRLADLTGAPPPDR